MPATHDWEYRAPGPVASRFLKSDKFVRGIRGPIGSGKSTACVMEVIFRSAAQESGKDGLRNTRWAIVRNSYPELSTTTIKTWHQWVPPELGRWVAHGPPTHVLTGNINLDAVKPAAEHTVTVNDMRMEVLFVALDRPEDIRKLLSMELTGAWINEAREVPKAILDGLTGRVGRYPPKRDGGCTWSGVIMDTNSPDSDHWWYRLAEEHTPDDYDFFAQPGGRTAFAENLDNLPERYYERASQGKSADWIRVYIDGEYGFVQDGKPVYHEFIDSLHIQECDPSKRLPITVGLDFGLTPAALFGQKLPSGRWIWIDELVSEDMGAVRFGELLSAKLSGEYQGFEVSGIWGDPAGDIRVQTDEKTPFQILRAAGIPASPAPSNDFTLRREAVAKPLTRLIDGKPGLIIHPRCRITRKGMAGGYRYRRIQVAGQERYNDKPEKSMFSHVCEAGQYMMMGAGEGAALIRQSPFAMRHTTSHLQTRAIVSSNRPQHFSGGRRR